MRTPVLLLLWSFLDALLPVSAPAQCSNQWLPGFGTAGVAGIVDDMVQWDPDGPSGPATPLLVVVGQFVTAANVAANNVVTYDPVSDTWAPMGNGVNGFVRTVAVSPSGTLLIGGSFTHSGATFCGGIAQWDGAAWVPYGGVAPVAYFGGGVWTLLPRANGELWVGGLFQSVQGAPGNFLVRATPGGWAPIGPGFDNFVLDLVEMPNGDVVAAGNFTSPPGRTARWNGSVWAPLGTGLNETYNSFDLDLELTSSGDLVAVGAFSTAGGVQTGPVARWNGAAWAAVGSPPFLYGSTICARPTGLLVGSYGGGMVHEWNGSAWTTIATGAVAIGVNAVDVLPDGRIVAGGSFPHIDAVRAQNIAARIGSTWHAMAPGFDERVLGLAGRVDGTFAAVGSFLLAGGVPANFVANWNGTTWQALGSGLNDLAFDVAILANGDIVASGYFTTAGGVPANHIARWNGATWQAMGQGITAPGTWYNPVAALAHLANGHLVVGGNFTVAGSSVAQNLAVWNGTAWQSIFGLDGTVRSILELRNGEWIVGGSFLHAGAATANGIARWNGTNWSALGTGTSSAVMSLAEMPNGDIIAGGNFSAAGGLPANRVARWNGNSWSAMGGGLTFMPLRLVVLPNGDVVAAGGTSPGTATNAARWNGSSWQALGNGTLLEDAVFLPSGELLFAGSMSTPLQTAGPIARLATSCPPNVASYGAGCVGGAGLVVLQATNAPWLQSTFRSRATGLVPTALAVGVYGFSQVAIPLASGHPAGLPGCDLLVADEILIQFLVGPGYVETHINIPNDPSLAGTSFYHQVVPVEINALGNILALTSSNALAVTMGVF